MKFKILLVLMLTIIGCKDMVKDDRLSLVKQPFTGNQLRIDGYWYQNVNNRYFPESFYYENGVLLYLSGNFSSKAEIQEYIQKEFLNIHNYRSSKLRWGLYNIDGMNIKFERWYPDPPLKAYVREGQIIYDETFIITESYRMVDGQKTEIREENDIYYFQEFSPKPDSTNDFL